MRKCSPHTTCQVSGVTCKVSRVTCQVPHLLLLLFLYIAIYIFCLGQIGEASRWMVCYEQGLPRLVLPYIRPCRCIYQKNTYFQIKFTNAILVFTSWLVPTCRVPRHPHAYNIQQKYSVRCTVHCSLFTVLYNEQCMSQKLYLSLFS